MSNSTRKMITDVFSEAKINIARLYSSFEKYYSDKFIYGIYNSVFDASIEEICDEHFDKFPLPVGFLNYKEYYYSFDFPSYINNQDLDIFLEYCEFLLNFVSNTESLKNSIPEVEFSKFNQRSNFLKRQILEVLDGIGYDIQIDSETKLIYCIERNAAAKTVATLDFVAAEPSASYKIIEYNRVSLKGNITQKRGILLILSKIFEGNRHELRIINSSLETDIGFLINNFNIRHENLVKSSSNYKPYVDGLSSDKLEEIYDMTYDLFLQAFISLDNNKLTGYIKSLKEELKDANK